MAMVKFTWHPQHQTSDEWNIQECKKYTCWLIFIYRPQILPEVCPKFARSLPKVAQSLPKVCPKFAQSLSKWKIPQQQQNLIGYFPITPFQMLNLNQSHFS